MSLSYLENYEAVEYGRFGDLFASPNILQVSSSSHDHSFNQDDEQLVYNDSPNQHSVTPKRSDLQRGRPRADAITNLIIKGSSSKSNIKCPVCTRVFPREKSLQAHLRTHTGEKPYTCDYPSCTKSFAQSGQLKTHQRLHAGEKPFCCTVTGCDVRFTHANRHCPQHPQAGLKRSKDVVLQPTISSGQNREEVLVWLEKYRQERELSNAFGDKSDAENEPGVICTTPAAPRKLKSRKEDMNEKFSSCFTPPRSKPQDAENIPQENSSTPVRLDRKRLPLSPLKISSNNANQVPADERKFCMPKKRWLREASRQMAQQISNTVVKQEIKFDSDAENNALCNLPSFSTTFGGYDVIPAPIQPPIKCEPVTLNREWMSPDPNKMLGAMALVELGTQAVSEEFPLNLSVPSYQP
ncbi:unnamed protein product [Notodromas monacha]|uniref:C2H2-type domain-containing protein n=1 Tax=Notodromas monacha TaxID=399045 RepID=A0A7R9GDQ6_9CRUS|nr:unnamed protein product [Notodromas monacha]CAG0917464.1 unnamed protein product [Notodromas monacha]